MILSDQHIVRSSRNVCLLVGTVLALAFLLSSCARHGGPTTAEFALEQAAPTGDVMEHDMIRQWLSADLLDPQRNSYRVSSGQTKKPKEIIGAKENHYPSILPLWKGQQFIVFPTTQWGLKDCNMNYSFFTSGDKCYEIGTMRGGFLKRGILWGDESGVWSQPYKMLDGVLVEIEEGDRVWTLNDGRHFTNHLYGVSFRFENDGLQVKRTDFSPEGHYAFVHQLQLRNTTPTARNIVLRFTFQENIRPMWHKPWVRSYGADSVLWESNTCFVARDPLIENVAVAFGGVKHADRYRIDRRNPFRNRGILEYDVTLLAGEEENFDFLTVMADRKKLATVFPGEQDVDAVGYFKRLKPKISGLRTGKETFYQRIFAEGPHFSSPDTLLNRAWLSARYNIQALHTDVRPYFPFTYIMTCPERAYQLLFGIDPLYTSIGATTAGFPGIVRETLLNHHHFAADLDYTAIQYVVNHWGEHDGKGSRAQETTQYIATVWEYAKLTGDLALCRRLYPDLKRLWEAVLHYDKDGDYWPEGMTFPHISQASGADEMISAAVRMVWATRAIGGMASVLRNGTDAKRFQHLADTLQARFNTEWWSEERSCWAVGMKNQPSGDKQVFLPNFHYGSVNYPARYQVANQNNGAQALTTVWEDAVDSLNGFHSPAVTAWQSGNMAIACYHYQRPDLGIKLLRRIAMNPVRLEKMLGAFSTVNPYPSQPARNDNKLMYNWGAGPFLEAIVVGLLGIEANAFDNTVHFNPQIPGEWEQASLYSFRMGDHLMDFVYQEPDWKISLRAGEEPLTIIYPHKADAITLMPFSSVNLKTVDTP